MGVEGLGEGGGGGEGGGLGVGTGAGVGICKHKTAAYQDTDTEKAPTYYPSEMILTFGGLRDSPMRPLEYLDFSQPAGPVSKAVQHCFLAMM